MERMRASLRAAAACGLGLAALAFAAPAGAADKPAETHGRTIGLAVTQYPFALYKGADDCPDGMAKAAKELYLDSVAPAERVRLQNVLGMAVAAAGLVLIESGAHSGNVTVLGFVLTLAAAFCWACGNIVVKFVHKVDVLGLVVWGAVVPPIPFLLLSWAFEGKAAIYHSLANLSVVGVSALIYLALIARFTRATMMDVLTQDYVRTARAKGLGQQKILYIHALKNAALPIVTVIGLSFGNLLNGTVIVEFIFTLPGIGNLLVGGINSRDYGMVQTLILFYALIFVLINCATDLVYRIFDPRVQF